MKSINKQLSFVVALALSAGIFQTVVLANEQTKNSLQGEGTCVAIIDRGFDPVHESFVLTSDNLSLTKDELDEAFINSKAYEGKTDLKSDNVYISEKIPFAYDYGDKDTDVTNPVYSNNGTAMISIIAGNGKNLENAPLGSTGIAPEAQVLLMKVYSDTQDAVLEEATVAAIDDAILFGVDVIYIAVGEMCGFGENNTNLSELALAVKRADEAGVIVVSPAGDNIKYGSESVFDNAYGITDVLTSMQDIGTVAAPSSYSTVLSVGSSKSNLVKSEYFTLPSGAKIPYGDSNYLYQSLTAGKTFSEFFNGQSFEYVMTGCEGEVEKLSLCGDLTGKFAVINRGIITFAEKAANAAALGAVGVIIVDNQVDQRLALKVMMDLTEAPIPAIIISGSNGDILANEEEKVINIKSGDLYLTEMNKTPVLSEFSAYGTTPELNLKPDLTAFGEAVECALAGGGYAMISSTTAAGARVSGMCLILLEHLDVTMQGTEKKELVSLVKTLLVNSAEKMEYTNDIPYSPRMQGGGNADLESALNTDVVLTSKGNFKSEEGDGWRNFVYTYVTLTNISDKAQKCILNAAVGTNGYDEFTYEMLDGEYENERLADKFGAKPEDKIFFSKDYEILKNTRVYISDGMFELNPYKDNYSPYEITLGPGESDTVKLSFLINPEDYSVLKERFTNGFFVEGFVNVSYGTVNDGRGTEKSSSIPIVAFSGNFEGAPFIDGDVYRGKQQIYDSIYLYRNINHELIDDYFYILGASPFNQNDNIAFSKEKLYFSPVVDNKNSAVYLNLALLRNVTDLKISVSDSEGNIICNKIYGSVRRTYVSRSTGYAASESIEIWDGRADDNKAYIYPDGEYTVKITFASPNKKNSYSFEYTLKLDTEAPRIENYSFGKLEELDALFLEAADNTEIDKIIVSDNNGVEAEYIQDKLWNISELSGKYIYVEVIDCSLNSVVLRYMNPNYTE